eukprot:NODE_3712_length_1997_cov_5.587166.p3 GENE.NODE_3712_length_1997_cov_5.587166~~NODE_3712_length_1997_cov_5.587166.p3  ORF type:complete len:182 (-),score=51.36 NODE_3712_length_1997_cov_5.587166:1133-1678(-)
MLMLVQHGGSDGSSSAGRGEADVKEDGNRSRDQLYEQTALVFSQRSPRSIGVAATAQEQLRGRGEVFEEAARIFARHVKASPRREDSAARGQVYEDAARMFAQHISPRGEVAKASGAGGDTMYEFAAARAVVPLTQLVQTRVEEHVVAGAETNSAKALNAPLQQQLPRLPGGNVFSRADQR